MGGTDGMGWDWWIRVNGMVCERCVLAGLLGGEREGVVVLCCFFFLAGSWGGGGLADTYAYRISESRQEEDIPRILSPHGLFACLNVWCQDGVILCFLSFFLSFLLSFLLSQASHVSKRASVWKYT